LEEAMTKPSMAISAFHSPIETGIRSLGVLAASYPKNYDLQRLVVFDHLVVHTGDLGGPVSLHPRLPLRSAELLVRRSLVERGLMLMVSRGLVERVVDEQGFSYRAGELAETFLESLATTYMLALRERANWVAENFAFSSEEDIQETMNTIFDQWVDQFHSTQAQSEANQ
jgi:hypothetical protein